DFARREMFASSLVREFSELADQLFEGKPHLAVADNIGVEIDPSKLLCDLIEQMALGELLNLRGKIKSLENVASGRGERLHVSKQVLANMVLIPHQLAHVHGRRVVEALTGGAEQESIR